MSRNNKKRKKELPSWAKLSAPTFALDATNQRRVDPLPDDHCYIQTKTYVCVSRYLEETLQKVLKDLCPELFSSTVSTTTAAPQPITSHPYCILPPCSASPTDALPVCLLSGPYDPQDRHYWMNVIVESLQQQQKKQKVLRLTSLRHFFTDCRLDGVSLRDYCSSSSHNDISGITVVLELQHQNDWWSYDSVLTDCLDYLMEQRCQYGVPVSVLVLAPLAQCQPPLHFRGGAALCEVSHAQLPLSGVVLSEFWRRVTRHLPFPGVNFQHLSQTFPAHASIVQLLHDWKLQLAESLFNEDQNTAVWSYWPVLPPTLRRRALATLYDQSSLATTRSIHDNYTASITTHYQAVVAWSLLQVLLENERKDDGTNDEPLLFCPFVPVQPRPLTKADQTQLLRILAKLRSTLPDWVLPDGHPLVNTEHLESVQQHVCDCINELIVLVDHFSCRSDVRRCLNALIEASWKAKSGTQTNCTDPPQPRRDTVSALCTDIANGGPFNVPGCLYQTILNRTSIGQGEWFQTFVECFSTENHPTDSNNETLWQLFACGVRHLQVAGLIRLRTGKAETTFERTAVVWCGGD